MFGLMRKLISKPFADTHEKRDQMDKLVCNMVEGIPMQPTETIHLNSVTGPKTVKGHVCVGGNIFMEWPVKTATKDEYSQSSIKSASTKETIKGKPDYGDRKTTESENKKFADKVAALVDSATTIGRPVWRPHNGRDLPADAVKVFEFGKVAQVVGVYQGWHSVKYSEGGSVFDSQDSRVEFVFCGEYVRRVECKECEGGGKEIQSKTNRHSDYGLVRVETKYTGAKCPYCKGKGYTLERFKR